MPKEDFDHISTILIHEDGTGWVSIYQHQIFNLSESDLLLGSNVILDLTEILPELNLMNYMNF
jgi:hypothetical protein